MEKLKDYPKVSIIVCTRNEAPNLPYVLPKIPDWVDEILLVDAHSEDATVEITKDQRLGDGRFKPIVGLFGDTILMR
jgi:glycosyltransferase involved in cell wall biosynthesis